MESRRTSATLPGNADVRVRFVWRMLPLALIAGAVLAVGGLAGGVHGVWELVAPRAPVERVAAPVGSMPEAPAIPLRR